MTKKIITPESTDAPVVVIAPSVEQVRKRHAAGKLKRRDIARYLAGLSTYHELGVPVPPHFMEGVLVTIPLEVVKLIGPALVTRREWLEAKADAARQMHARWQAQADEFWRQHPDGSASEAAKAINPVRWQTIRKRIRKPRK